MAKRIREKAEQRKANADQRPRATASYVRISPYKVRSVIDIVRGKSYNEACAILKNRRKSASDVIYKLINSAAANAEHNKNIEKDALYVAEIFANQGPTLKRIRPKDHGKAFRILKKTSHITVILDREDNK